MYVSSLLLSTAKKDWFQLDRLGAAFQRKQGTDFTALYSMYKSQDEAKSRSWQVLSTQGRNWLQKMFLWVKYIYLRGLQKCCFPVKIKQPACSSPSPSWPILEPKKSCCKAFSWAKIQWLLCLLGFLLLSAFVSAEVLLLKLWQAHKDHYLSLQALLFYSHRPVSFSLCGISRICSHSFGDLVQPESPVICKTFLWAHSPPPAMHPGWNSAEIPQDIHIYLFFFKTPSALISTGAGCLICLYTFENPIKCLFAALGA